MRNNNGYGVKAGVGEALGERIGTVDAPFVPIHWQGWSHYRESRDEIQAAFAADGLAAQVLWSTPGVPVDVSV